MMLKGLLISLSVFAAPMVQSQTNESKLVEDFKFQLDRTVSQITNRSNQYDPKKAPQYEGKWYKKSCVIENLNFDIQRTQSLVSPYVAIVTAKVMDEYDGPFNSKSEALNAPSSRKATRVFGMASIKVEYARQGDQWALKDAKGQFGSSGWESVWSGPLGNADESYCLVHSSWAAIR